MTYHFKSLAQLHEFNGYPAPEHPMLSLLRCTQTCPLGTRVYTGDFYMIAFKKMKKGEIIYGKTKYDNSSGSLYFTSPRQQIEMRNIELEEDGFAIYIHEDYLNGHPLHTAIKSYRYFDYETDEALHLSPKEEEIIRDLYSKIEGEYYNNQDEYSKEIMLGHIEAILKYAQRFYKRQFINRTPLSGKVVTRMNHLLGEYFRTGAYLEKGLPTVKSMASQLHVSASYLSDLLKQETGKTAIETIHIFLIQEAKNRLAKEEGTIAETAYNLGFENLSYFSRLFKKEVGISPNQFRKQQLN